MERYTSQINNKAIAAIISRQIKRNCSLHVWPCISKNYLALARHVPSTRWSLPGSRAGAGWAGTAALAAVSAPRGGTAPQGPGGLRLAPVPAWEWARAREWASPPRSCPAALPRAPLAAPPRPAAQGSQDPGCSPSGGEELTRAGQTHQPVRYTLSTSCSAETSFKCAS